MRTRVTRSPLKTLNRLVHRVKYSEKTRNPTKLQAQQCSGRDSGETHIAVALDGPFKAAKQQVNGVLIHLPNLGTVEHNARALDIHAARKVAKKEPPSFYIQLLR
jgi:hypothetical protein